MVLAEIMGFGCRLEGKDGNKQNTMVNPTGSHFQNKTVLQAEDPHLQPSRAKEVLFPFLEDELQQERSHFLLCPECPS